MGSKPKCTRNMTGMKRCKHAYSNHAVIEGEEDKRGACSLCSCRAYAPPEKYR